MLQERDLAIVLKSIPYEERSKIVTAVTEHHGLITAIARNGVQSRRFGGALDLFVAAEWQFRSKAGSEWVSVTEAQVRRDYAGIRKDWERMGCASAASELLSRVAPRSEPCRDLFLLHAHALAHLEESAELSNLRGQRLFMSVYVAKVLSWSGVSPRLERCLGCDTGLENLDEDAFWGVPAEAGWYCAACQRANGSKGGSGRLPRVELNALILLQGYPMKQVLQTADPQSDYRGLYDFVYGLLVYHIPGIDERPLRSFKFLNENVGTTLAEDSAAQSIGPRAEESPQ